MSFEKGKLVRWLYDNRRGECTGRSAGTRVEVRFDASEIKFISRDDLEIVASDESMGDRFVRGAFQGIEDFRRVINRYRLSGELTDIIYSMSNSKTEFLPHQFIPVMKFLESYSERLLIADEVGLGKTIEAMYIWEELRARYGARKLLIVVPASVKYKWKGDIERYFNLEAQVVNHIQAKDSSDSLLAKIRHAIDNPGRDAFVCIVSIQGIRTSKEIYEILEEQADIRNIFDLVIIDEAHHMRNASTKSFKIAERLRDVSERFLLLSATPIQTSSLNFYNLLCLLAPEEFSSYFESFCLQLNDLAPLVRLANAIENKAEKSVIVKLTDIVLENPTFSLDANCLYLKKHIDEILKSPSEQIRIVGNLKSKFFYDNYVIRRRKRDVFENRTERRACSVEFTLSPVERQFYKEVTEYLDTRYDPDGKTFSAFRLISRQRQMSSCMYAALDSWRHPGRKSGVDDDEESDNEWEDFDDDSQSSGESLAMPVFPNINIEKLRSDDSKYNAISDQIKAILKGSPSEKIIIFSFFRGTVKYLADRLTEDGIRVSCMMGGVSGEEKARIVDNFRDSTVNVLISTEVGSEGIDLQFAKYEVNYDLPWNPMRLEQRIGRIDRIGQKSPAIYIYNAFCKDTIEDQILSRLYGRIEIFRTIIGDLEEILGEVVKDLELDVFRNRKPTKGEIEAKFHQIELAFENKRKMSFELEKDAGYLTTYQQHILDNVRRSKDNTRRLTSEELYFAIKDYLNATYPGSSVSTLDSYSCARIALSDSARKSFAQYIDENNGLSYSSLGIDKSGAVCVFGDRAAPSGTYRERIDINHSLVRWILFELRRDVSTLSGCDLLQVSREVLKRGSCDILPGTYCYYIQNWIMDGVRSINELHYYVADANTGKLVDRDIGEKLMMGCMLHGASCDVGDLSGELHEAAIGAVDTCISTAFDEFDQYAEEQAKRNNELIEEQRQYVLRVSERKISRLEQIIEQLRISGKKEGVLKLWKGKCDHVIQDRDSRLDRFERKMKTAPSVSEVAMGVVIVKV